jgi:transposase
MARGDLTDPQWQRIGPILPPERSGKPGHPYKQHRTILNGMLWIVRTGAPWRDLPERYGPWQTVYDRFVRWQQQGVWTRLLQALQAQQDQADNLEWSGCAVDSTSIKAHPHAAGARHKPTVEKGGTRLRRRPRTRRSGAAEAG